MADDVSGAAHASFGALYAPVAASLVAWSSLRVRRSLRTWIEPQDLAQEAVCRAFERFRTFDPSKGTFRGWLFGIANNVLRESLAAAARPAARPLKLEASSRDLLDQLPDHITSVSRRLARDETFRAFIDKLDALDDDDRRLLVMRGLEGLNHGDAAEVLGISRDAAEKRWQRLVRRVEEFRPPADLFA